MNFDVGDCLVGPHVLSHRLTGNHCREFLLYDRPKLLEEVPLAVRERMWYMHDGAPAVPCEMFSVAPIITDGQMEEESLHDLHAHQI
jgi:hypothetical protein